MCCLEGATLCWVIWWAPNASSVSSTNMFPGNWACYTGRRSRPHPGPQSLRLCSWTNELKWKAALPEPLCFTDNVTGDAKRVIHNLLDSFSLLLSFITGGLLFTLNCCSGCVVTEAGSLGSLPADLRSSRLWLNHPTAQKFFHVSNW